jgi:hypothetical protein
VPTYTESRKRAIQLVRDDLDVVMHEEATGAFNEVTFRLKQPQPSFLALLASGWSPV